MRIPSLARWALAVTSAAAFIACDRGEPPAPPPAASPEAPLPAPAVSAEPAASDVVVIPPFDPSLEPLEIEPPPIPEAQAQAQRAKPKSSSPSAPRSPATTAKAEPDHLPLDALFRARYGPPGPSTTVDLAPVDLAAPVKHAPKPPRALDRLGDSIRLERRGEKIGPAGPRQGTAWETDAGVRIPVDESISLEGGVRVESREEPGVKQKDEARRTPKLGVEVRF